jgi:hypothetical protein
MSRIVNLAGAVSKAMLISLALAAATSARAHPVDEKGYAGASCQPGPSIPRESLEYSIEGFVTNTNKDRDGQHASVWVVCPIIYDIFDVDREPALRGIGHGGVRVEVRVNKTDASTLRCELRSMNAFGTSENVQVTSDTSGAGNQTLAIAQVNQFDGAGKGGYYVLACRLPAGHSLRSYYVFEH